MTYFYHSPVLHNILHKLIFFIRYYLYFIIYPENEETKYLNCTRSYLYLAQMRVCVCDHSYYAIDEPPLT